MTKLPRKLLPLVALLLAIFAIPWRAFAEQDTGTYEIRDYVVALSPLPNGSVEMRYEQEWLVTGGHIPWVTVGLANPNFQVKSYGGSAARVSPENSSGWNGIRVDLDKDYKQNESFRFYVVLDQRNLLQAAPTGWRIAFTPGWYDRALIDSLKIDLTAPVPSESFSFTPQPARIEGNHIIWEKKDLSRGQRFPVGIESTDVSFLTLIPTVGPGGNEGALVSGPGPAPSDGSGWVGGIVGLTVIAGFLALVVWSMVRSRRRGAEGDNEGGSGGGYLPPAVFLPGHVPSPGSSGGHRPTGGGGGFGGRSVSCACACVSCACACACACAGGGGAGCGRKVHLCQQCRNSEGR